MSAGSPQSPITSPKLLPGTEAAPSADPTAVISAVTPPRQLSELPKDELDALAEDFGLDPTRFKSRQFLVGAIHDRRQLIAASDREALLDVIRWGRRPVAANATKEQLAQEIARIRSMKFSGLSHRGLVVLAQLRGLGVRDADPVPLLVRKLRRQEGILAKLSRARRAVVASLVARLVGDADASREYRVLPPQQPPASSPLLRPPGSPGTPTDAAPRRAASLKEDIEESGLLGGLTNRIKKTADGYLNQKLDEIESRIDRKLDEIDRRLAEWRDKEIANRIRILKITLWASVIVGIFSLMYAYLKTYLPSVLGH